VDRFSSARGEGFGKGLDLTSVVLSGLLLGLALDWWLGTRPWFVILGTVTGAVWGFRKAMHATREIDRGGE
jgi:F0F1-type ATP synthase assembly protein I